MVSNLYIVSTPIGNLEDITKRALRILSEVDLILCEDTRVTKKLLEHYRIETPTLSYHQHSKLKKVNYILEILRQGKNLALVSDAGTPGISDPGNRLISVIITSPGLVVKIVPLPGPSAVTAAASISGFPMDKFIFMGFPPAKRKKRKFFKEVSNSKYPVIFYESPYRVIKSLCDLRETDANQNAKPMRKIVVCRELTKKFEAIYRGTIDEIIKKIERSPSGGSPAGRKLKGEFAIVVEGK